MAVDPVRVWDWPTRLIHWLLAAAVAGCWWTAEHDQMQIHLLLGESVLGLLLLRLYWGFVGASTARFSTFLRGPRAILGYVRSLAGRAPSASVGHNPLGAFSVMALLALMLIETAAGLLAVDVDGIESGPLSYLVSFDLGRLAAQIHHLAFDGLLGLIALHLAAVAFYLLYKRDNLIGAMITGRRRGVFAEHEALKPAPTWRLIVGAAIVAAVVVLIARAH